MSTDLPSPDHVDSLDRAMGADPGLRAACETLFRIRTEKRLSGFLWTLHRPTATTRIAAEHEEDRQKRIAEARKAVAKERQRVREAWFAQRLEERRAWRGACSSSR